MLVAAEESSAPEVTYPVGRSGWHEIYIGIYRIPFHQQGPMVQVKLTDDPAYTVLRGRPGVKDHQENWIDEIFWKAADLTGQDIIFRQILESMIGDARVRHAWVAFIKLIPLSEPEVRELKADRSHTDTRRLFVHSDAHFQNISGSELNLRNYLEPFRHSDVSRIYWEAGGGDYAIYFSKIANDYSSLLDVKDRGKKPFFPRTFYRLFAKTWQAYRRKGVDPLRVAAEFAHDIGLELHASYRMAGFLFPLTQGAVSLEKSFFGENPGLHCVDRDGTPLPRISYAFPATRRYVISLFGEMAANYSIDGVCLLYNRRPPLLAYEPPLIEGFQARYGKDPRELDEKDPEWLSYRSSVLTQFMRELRREMDFVAQEQKRAKRLEVSAVVFREEENLLHGMDLKTWIQEGLVDTIIPYSSSVRLNSNVPAWEDPQDIAYFVSLVKGTNCRLALNMMPRDLTPEEYYRKAHSLYQAGVENLFFWDGLNRVRKVPRLGHREEVAAWMTAGQPARLPSAVRLRKLGTWDLRIETPG